MKKQLEIILLQLKAKAQAIPQQQPPFATIIPCFGRCDNMEQFIPWQAILASPNSAWAVVFIIMLIFVMNQNSKREERYMDIVDGSLKEQTTTLSNINTSLANLHVAVCKTEERLDDIEDYLQINKVIDK